LEDKVRISLQLALVRSWIGNAQKANLSCRLRYSLCGSCLKSPRGADNINIRRMHVAQQHRAALERLQVRISHLEKLLRTRYIDDQNTYCITQAELKELKEQHGGRMHLRKPADAAAGPFPLTITITVPQPELATSYDCDSLKVGPPLVSQHASPHFCSWFTRQYTQPTRLLYLQIRTVLDRAFVEQREGEITGSDAAGTAWRCAYAVSSPTVVIL